MSDQRMGMAIRVVPEKLELYRQLHANPWPQMDAALGVANIRNYSIFLEPSHNLLFAYWEYTGSDFAADMKVLGDKEITRKWLALTDPCQEKLESADLGEWWANLPELYHLP